MIAGHVQQAGCNNTAGAQKRPYINLQINQRQDKEESKLGDAHRRLTFDSPCSRGADDKAASWWVGVKVSSGQILPFCRQDYRNLYRATLIRA